MASPQKENGYTPIANEILDQIMKYRLNGTQFRLLLAVWRYTYGFNRKEYSISENFLSKAIGVARHNINREIKLLFDNKILTVVKKPTYTEAAVIKFNKNYEEWQHISNPIAGIKTDKTYQECTFIGIELDTSTGIKSDTQENNAKTKKENNEHISFFESVWRLYPHKKGKQAVLTKTKKELCKVGYDIISKSIENYIAQKPEYQSYMNGSTFFNGRWQEFIDTAPETNNNYEPGDIRQWQN